MVRHNNAVPNGHFHKKWQQRVKTWFSQPMKKVRRRNRRLKKLLQATPQPVQPLRPVVHCPSVRYNLKVRIGRGFTLQELKRAGVHKKMARCIGIAVDYRRRNRCTESLTLNLHRIKEYRNNLIFYRSTFTENVAINNGEDLNKVTRAGAKAHAKIVTEDEKKFQAFTTLRCARNDLKYAGKRLKKKVSKSDFIEGGKI